MHGWEKYSTSKPENEAVYIDCPNGPISHDWCQCGHCGANNQCNGCCKRTAIPFSKETSRKCCETWSDKKCAQHLAGIFIWPCVTRSILRLRKKNGSTEWIFLNSDCNEKSETYVRIGGIFLHHCQYTDWNVGTQHVWYETYHKSE